MNKNCFRIVFSRVHRALVAVAETASSPRSSRGTSGVTSIRSLPLVWQLEVTAFGVLFVFGLTPVWVDAQIVANPNAAAQRPTVATTPSGIPLVQISKPTAAGVSPNQYSQFSVGRSGAVLNNSPTANQSQLAGWIPGNANLTTPARIILNQVTGNMPSVLAGPLEVAGGKAEVVIANSAGITCSGCGFINTSRGILTTGTPVMGPTGSLDAFRVTSGTVSFTGAGMNASNLDEVDVIARAVSVNANIYANSLNVVTGANQVDHATLGATPIAGTGATPSVSVDVSQLGGMYAQHIWLVGSERGVGVNDAGTIAAQSGDLTLSTQGKLVVSGNTNASGNLNLSAADGVQNSGSMYGLQSTTVNSPGDISNTGTIAGQDQVVVNGQNVTSTGSLAAGVDASGKIGKSGDLIVVAGNALSANGQNIAGGNLITANHDLTLSTTGTFTNDQRLSAAAGVTVNAANMVNVAGADIASGTAGDATTGQTTLNAGNGSGDINNAGRIEGNTVTTTSNTLENTGTIIGGTVTANANTLTNDGAAAIIAGTQQVNLWVPGIINNQNGATLYSLGDINMAANSGTDAKGNLINQTGTINNLSSTIQAGGNLNAAAKQINNVRENVLTTTTTKSQTYVMNELAWWHPGQPGNTAPFQDANTTIQDAYYVSASDIVSSSPVVTPDGYIVQRVVVNMPANASVFRWEQSGLAYGVLSQMTQPLAESGYYVMPVALMEETFKQNGLTTPADIQEVAPTRLRKIFGADTALYTKVTQYGSVYEVIDSTTVVAASARLVDLRTGDVLWQGTARGTGKDLGGNVNVNAFGLAGILVQAVVKQVAHSISDDSVPVAGLTSRRLLSAGTSNGLLYGPYSPKYGSD